MKPRLLSPSETDMTVRALEIHELAFFENLHGYLQSADSMSCPPKITETRTRAQRSFWKSMDQSHGRSTARAIISVQLAVLVQAARPILYATGGETVRTGQPEPWIRALYRAPCSSTEKRYKPNVHVTRNAMLGSFVTYKLQQCDADHVFQS